MTSVGWPYTGFLVIYTRVSSCSLQVYYCLVSSRLLSSYRLCSSGVLSRLALSCCVLYCPDLPCFVLSCRRVVSCTVMPCLVLPGFVIIILRMRFVRAREQPAQTTCLLHSAQCFPSHRGGSGARSRHVAARVVDGFRRPAGVGPCWLDLAPPRLLCRGLLVRAPRHATHLRRARRPVVRHHHVRRRRVRGLRRRRSYLVSGVDGRLGVGADAPRCLSAPERAAASSPQEARGLGR